MRTGGRLQAAIEILNEIESRHRPAADAIKDWALRHRFAGSNDRAFIGNLVYDVLRQRRSLAAIIGDDSPRGVVIAVYALSWNMGLDSLIEALSEPHAPGPLTKLERSAISRHINVIDTASVRPISDISTKISISSSSISSASTNHSINKMLANSNLGQPISHTIANSSTSSNSINNFISSVSTNHSVNKMLTKSNLGHFSIRLRCHKASKIQYIYNIARNIFCANLQALSANISCSHAIHEDLLFSLSYNCNNLYAISNAFIKCKYKTLGILGISLHSRMFFNTNASDLYRKGYLESHEPVTDQDFALSAQFHIDSNRWHSMQGACILDSVLFINMYHNSSESTSTRGLSTNGNLDRNMISRQLLRSGLPKPYSTHSETKCLYPTKSSDTETYPLDIPQWLLRSFIRVFGLDRLHHEVRALSLRAPVDLRVNTLKSQRSTILSQFDEWGGMPTEIAPHGIRIPPAYAGARMPSFENEPLLLQGLVEIQDEGSQIAAHLAAPLPNERVLDLCCGGGGKTLALAALQQDCHIFAYDNDKRRMRDLYMRSARAGIKNLQVITPKSGRSLDPYMHSMDLVLVDAPCTGTGTWRRRPDAKWRLSPSTLKLRLAEQDQILDTSLRLLAPGGRIVYITCSVLAEENEDRIQALLARHPRTLSVTDPLARVARHLRVKLEPLMHRETIPILRLSPGSSNTDGFGVVILQDTRLA